MVTYKDPEIEYRAQLVYVPAGDRHFIITMAAQAQDWAQYLPTFESFLISISGGMQGKRGKCPPCLHFLTSPHRATMIGVLVGIITMWIAMWVVLRK